MRIAFIRKFKVIYIITVLCTYVYGCSKGNELVRDSCGHGNCKHGWYSKYNTEEKQIASAWKMLSPLLFWGIYHLIFIKPTNKKLDSEEEDHIPETPYGTLKEYENHLRKIGVSENNIISEINKYK